MLSKKKDYRLAFQIVLLNHVFGILLKVLPFKKICHFLEVQEGEYKKGPTILQIEYLRHLRATFIATQEKWPFSFKCLTSTVTCAFILNKKNIPFNLYLGTFNDKNKLKAHSWIKSNNWCLTKERQNNYQVITKFTRYSL